MISGGGFHDDDDGGGNDEGIPYNGRVNYHRYQNHGNHRNLELKNDYGNFEKKKERFFLHWFIGNKWIGNNPTTDSWGGVNVPQQERNSNESTPLHHFSGKGFFRDDIHGYAERCALWSIPMILYSLFIYYLATKDLTETKLMISGETRHLLLPTFSGMFTKNMVVSYDPGPGSSGSGSGSSSFIVDTYVFRSSCPSLSGPIVNIHNEKILNLTEGEYKYYFYFLNSGSIISTTFSAHNDGSSGNVRLFRGYHTFHEYENEHDYYDEKHDVLPPQHASGGNGDVQLSCTSHYAHHHNSDNEFYMVYENANISFHNATTIDAQLSLFVNVTTYDMQGDNAQKCPTANSGTYNNKNVGCTIPLHSYWSWFTGSNKNTQNKEASWWGSNWNDCVILSASSVNSTFPNKTLSSSDGEDLVSVLIKRQCRLVTILGAAAYPILFLMFLYRNGGTNKKFYLY